MFMCFSLAGSYFHKNYVENNKLYLLVPNQAEEIYIFIAYIHDFLWRCIVIVVVMATNGAADDWSVTCASGELMNIRYRGSVKRTIDKKSQFTRTYVFLEDC